MYDVGLPKWPQLIVVGKKVTPDQAKEIIVRNNSIYLFTNDHEWNKKFLSYIGHPDSRDSDPFDLAKYLELSKTYNEKYKIIQTEYIQNNQIAGGMYGWVQWDGTVFTNSHNIGKWPSVETVLEDWQNIATAFPYLDLKAWLLDNENCIENNPVVQFNVSNGTAESVAPTDYIEAFSYIENKEKGINSLLHQILYHDVASEHVTFEKAKEVYDYVENLFKKEN